MCRLWNENRWWIQGRTPTHTYILTLCFVLFLLMFGNHARCQWHFVYRLIVSDTNAKHIKNMEHLHEANRYAQWSEQDRRSKLPPITEEQRQQIYEYLSMVQQHGLTKSLAAATAQASAEEDSTTSPQCPVVTSTHHYHNNTAPTPRSWRTQRCLFFLLTLPTTT